MRRQTSYPIQTVFPARAYRRVVLPRKRFSSEDRAALAAGSLVLLTYLGLSLLVAGIYMYFTLFELVLPGVKVGETRLSGLNVEQAAQKLQKDWANNTTVKLTNGSQSWTVPASSLGFALDAKRTAELAVRAGRSQSGWPNPLVLLGLNVQKVAPQVILRPETALKALTTAAAKLNVAPVEAGVQFKEGHWLATSGRNGSVLDAEATLKFWQSNPGELLRIGLLPIKMQTISPQVMDASSEVARLDGLMQKPLQLRAYDPITDETLQLDLPPEKLAGMIRVSQGSSGPVMQIDPAAFNQYLAQLNLGQNRRLGDLPDFSDLTGHWQAGQAYYLTVKHNPTAYTVEAGDTLVSIAFKVGIPWWKIRDANPDINPNALPAGQNVTIPSLDTNLPAAVVANKRIIISISQQRLWTYENGQQRTESVISTGIGRSPTMPGIYQIQTHVINAYASIWDLYMPHFMGIYEAAPGFMNGIHGLPLLSSGVRLWANVLGQPASYGCIILTLKEAEDLYNWAEDGVVVEIRP